VTKSSPSFAGNMARLRSPTERAAEMHRAGFEEEPDVLAFAPGRIELLGNHTDYNQGLALAAALPFGIAVAVTLSTDGRCCAVSADLSTEAHFNVWDDRRETALPWVNYVKGTAQELMTRYGPQALGFHATVAGNLPRGAGLASSAALAMASGLAFCRLYGWPDERSELALAGRRAEENYAGVRCGLLDQLASLYGKAGHAALLDFRSLEIDHVPLPDTLRLLLVHSGIVHDNAAGAYNARRLECEQALSGLADSLRKPLESLRDISVSDFAKLSSRLPEATARRARHVIDENARTAAGAELLRCGDVEAFGRLMYASHESSCTNFENSCPELDFLVATARGLPGVLGARLTGGGFGGSIVVLVEATRAAAIDAALKEAYQERFLRAAETLLVSPSAGAYVV
jgi:galactokinase